MVTVSPRYAANRIHDFEISVSLHLLHSTTLPGFGGFQHSFNDQQILQCFLWAVAVGLVAAQRSCKAANCISFMPSQGIERVCPAGYFDKATLHTQTARITHNVQQRLPCRSSDKAQQIAAEDAILHANGGG